MEATREDKKVTTERSLLPEGCISHILSLTSPRDTCALAAVSSIFRSAADSDIIWEGFLPPDYEDILSRAVAPVEFLSKKDLYFQLCHPILIDGGRKSFVLEKSTGKKCFMLSARELSVDGGDVPGYWTWISFPLSRFEEVVAEVRSLCHLNITGRLRMTELSPDTTYVAYLIFKLTKKWNDPDQPVHRMTYCTRSLTELLCRKRGETTSTPETYWPGGILNFRSQIMNPEVQTPSTPIEEGNRVPCVRADGWFEVVIGEFFNESGNEEEVVMSLSEIERMNLMRGLVVEGIDVRPKK